MRFEERIVGGLAGLALLLAGYAALSRYLFPEFAAGWVDELVIYTSVWAIWLSGSLLVAEQGHVRADVLAHFIDARLAQRLARFGLLLGFAFCALMVYAGLMVVALSLRLGERSDSVLALPLYLYYAGFPVGMGLMAWRYWQLVLAEQAQADD